MSSNFIQKYLGINVSRYIPPNEEKPLPLQGEKKVQVGRFSLTANESHLIEDYLSYYKYYSRNLARIARLIGETYASSSIVDVGANIGDSIALIRNEGCGNRIYAIEGDKNYFHILEKNTKALFENVSVHNFFLAENKAVIKSELVASGGTLNLKQNSEEGNDIELITMDEFVSASGIRDIKLIKVDTDGFDFMILRGASNTIASQQPVLFLEYDDKFLKQNNEDGLLTLIQLREKGYDRIMYYDNFGRFLTAGTLSDTGLIEDMYGYIRERNGAFPYFDLCIFHANDFSLADKVISSERAYFRNN